VPALCRRDLASADIGAHWGEYAMRAIPYSGRCLLFEPRPDEVRALRRVFLQSAHIEAVALSDEAGTAELRVPRGGGPRSTIAPSNELEYTQDVEVIRVPTRRLDDYAEHRFGFVKIDVEGHEEAVLRGGSLVLERDRPALLIEIENRHNPGALERIAKMLAAWGYSGWFLHQARLQQLAEFSADVLQLPANIAGGKKLGTYINNFLFAQPRQLSRLERWRG
jgi:FkbM family methyltransferase